MVTVQRRYATVYPFRFQTTCARAYTFQMQSVKACRLQTTATMAYAVRTTSARAYTFRMTSVKVCFFQTTSCPSVCLLDAARVVQTMSVTANGV
jgi:hypothetical protein